MHFQIYRQLETALLEVGDSDLRDLRHSSYSLRFRIHTLKKVLDTIHDLDYCMQVAIMVTVTAHDSYAVWNAGKPRKFYQIRCALMSAQIHKTQSVVITGTG
jgi:hypothetical protein